jgi:hypothetical protein
MQQKRIQPWSTDYTARSAVRAKLWPITSQIHDSENLVRIWLVEIEKRQLALQFRRYVALFTIDASQ